MGVFLKVFDLKNWVCQLTKSVDWKVRGRHNRRYNSLCCFQCTVQSAHLNQRSLNHLTLLSDWTSNLCKFKEKKCILMFMLQCLLLSSTRVNFWEGWGVAEFHPPYNYHKAYYTISDRTILCIISNKSQITAEWIYFIWKWLLQL